LYRECLAGAQIIFPESGRGLGHVTPTIFGSTVGYPSDSLVSCYTVNIQHAITDNNAVFSEDCNGSVWKSWEGGDGVDNV